MMSQVTMLQLKELTGESDYESSVQKLVFEYLELKLSYWKLIDKQFEEKKECHF